MIGEVCAELRNWFCDKKLIGRVIIENGCISVIEDGKKERAELSEMVSEGQYIRVIGSVFNDGVYKFGYLFSQDESFDGAVWLMKPPADFLKLVDEIEAYNSSDAAKPSPFISESFGGYQYTKVSDYKGGTCTGWQSVFRQKLNRWRKIL